MELYNWNEEDLEDLDRKFDALAEFLGVEFVFERVSNGSDAADESRCYARYKEKGETRLPTPAESSIKTWEENVPIETTETTEESAGVEPPKDYYAKKKKKYTDY